jgi:hypothetical protein
MNLRTLDVEYHMWDGDQTSQYFKTVMDALEVFAVKGKVKVKIFAHHLKGPATLREEDACAAQENKITDPRRREEVGKDAGGDEDGMLVVL